MSEFLAYLQREVRTITEFFDIFSNKQQATVLNLIAKNGSGSDPEVGKVVAKFDKRAQKKVHKRNQQAPTT